jgi:hypothetical protein
MRKAFGVAMWLGGLAAAACSSERAHIGLELRVPQGLLDTASGVELRVSQGGACNEDTGSITDESGFVSFDLDRCGAGWCKDVKLDRDDQEHLFHVIASAGGGPVAEGCKLATIDKDPLNVDIRVHKFVPPGCCNNGKVESREQCDNGIKAMTNCANMPVSGNGSCNSIVGDEVCACDCLANELLLSVAGTAPTTDNDPGSKTDLSLAFSGPTGSPDVASSLRAAYTDNKGFAGDADVNVRLLKGNLFAVGSGPLAKQLRMPLSCMSTQGPGQARIQRAPQIARVSGDTSAVVYVNNITQPNQFNVSLVGLGPDGCAPAAEVQVNTDASASCEAPDVAGGPDGQALVVWNQAGQIKGRIWAVAGNMLSPAADIAIAGTAMGAKPHVSGGTKGWLVTYPGQAGGIVTKTVSPTGTVGTETKVNLVAGMTDSPDVAVHPDGSAVVVWQSGGKIFFQRYDANGAAHAGDQDQPLSTRTPAPASVPVVAADGGKWFAVAWLGGDGKVWSRFIGANVFGFNHVSGQNDDFMATHPGLKTTRSGPAIAINDAFVAIGWQDTSMEHPGVYVRRFPLPE